MFDIFGPFLLKRNSRFFSCLLKIKSTQSERFKTNLIQNEGPFSKNAVKFSTILQIVNQHFDKSETVFSFHKTFVHNIIIINSNSNK